MVRLALAYLLRRPVQALAVMGVAVGMGLLLVVLSVMNGLIEVDRASVRGPLSDLLLLPAVTEAPPAWSDYRDALAGLPEVAAAAPHLVAYAVLGYRDSARLMQKTTSSDINGVQLVGVDPELERRVGGFGRALDAAAQMPVADPARPFAGASDDPEEALFARPGVLVSDQIAGSQGLGVRAGQRLRFVALPPRLPPAGAPLEPLNGSFDVIGSYASTDYKLGLDRFYLDRRALRSELLGSTGPDFSEILLDLPDGVTPAAAKAAIRSALARAGLPEPGGPHGGSLQTWEERMASYLVAIDNERWLTGLIMFFIVVVAAFGLFATLSALVREKVRDLGVLAALGFSPLRRGALLLFTGATGSALGTALGYAGARWLAQGQRLQDLLATVDIEVFGADLYVVAGLPTAWLPEQARMFALGSLAVGVLFTLVPAIRAASLSPLEALRYE